jgi:hypothetical protein
MQYNGRAHRAMPGCAGGELVETPGEVLPLHAAAAALKVAGTRVK